MYSNDNSQESNWNQATIMMQHTLFQYNEFQYWIQYKKNDDCINRLQQHWDGAEEWAFRWRWRKRERKKEEEYYERMYLLLMHYRMNEISNTKYRSNTVNKSVPKLIWINKTIFDVLMLVWNDAIAFRLALCAWYCLFDDSREHFPSSFMFKA